MYRLLPPRKQDAKTQAIVAARAVPGHKPERVASRSRGASWALLKQLRSAVAQLLPRKERHKETAGP